MDSNATTTTVTVHGVLAGAYKGGRKALDKLLTHASADEGVTALCGRVAEHALCDQIEPGEPTCKVCAGKLAKAKAQTAANNAAASAAGLVKRGRGRPRNDASGANAERVVGVRLTAEQYARLAAAAAAANTSMSELLRGAWERDLDVER